MGSSTAAAFCSLRRSWLSARVRAPDAAKEGFLAVGFGGFDQAVDLRAGGSAFWSVAEQPVLAADDEGADGVLGAVVVDGQVSGFGIAHQTAPVLAR